MEWIPKDNDREREIVRRRSIRRSSLLGGFDRVAPAPKEEEEEEDQFCELLRTTTL